MRDAARFAPGVRAQFRASAPEAASQSGTAVTAFVGAAERGPLNQPQIVRSYGEYVQVFGESRRFGALSDSVYAFFLNGGERACVLRVGGGRERRLSGACLAAEPLQAASSQAPIRDSRAAEVLRLHARNEGRWGNRIRAVLHADALRDMDLAELRASAATGADGVDLDAVHDLRVGASVILAHAENPFLKSAHRIAAIDVDARHARLEPGLAFALPRRSALRGRGFRLDVSEGERRESFDALSMNPAHPRYFVDVINGEPGAEELAAERLGRSGLVRAEALRPAEALKPVDSPAPVTFSGGGDGIAFASAALRDAQGRLALTATARLGGRAGNGLAILVTPFRGALALAYTSADPDRARRLVLEDVRGWQPGDPLVVGDAEASEPALVESVSVDQQSLILVSPLARNHPLGTAVAGPSRFDVSVVDADTRELLERFRNLSLQSGTRFAPDALNAGIDDRAGSERICASAGDSSALPPFGVLQLAGGADPHEIPLELCLGYRADGSEALQDDARVGLARLEDVVDVQLVSVPDLAYRTDLDEEQRVAAGRLVLHHCRRTGDRFALLDLPFGLPSAAVFEWPSRFADPGLMRYGALYYPWIRLARADETRALPPSGAVAGLIARSDRLEGVARAPANLPFKGVVGLEVELDDDALAALNGQHVNCIRKLEPGVIQLWGARTLSLENDYTYVHQRRVVLLAIQTMSRNLRWAVFEPNDARLRQRIQDSLEGLLSGLLASGLAVGDRPEDAYFVKVEPFAPESESQVVAHVGIAVSSPAEFIVLSVTRRPEVLFLVEEEA